MLTTLEPHPAMLEISSATLPPVPTDSSPVLPLPEQPEAALDKRSWYSYALGIATLAGTVAIIFAPGAETTPPSPASTIETTHLHPLELKTDTLSHATIPPPRTPGKTPKPRPVVTPKTPKPIPTPRPS